MEWVPECRKTVNIFVNTSLLDAHTFNIIDNIERVRSAIKSIVLFAFSVV